MIWNEVVIITSTEAAEAAAELLQEAGAKGTVIEDEWDYILLKDDGFGQIKEQRTISEKNHDVFVKAYFMDADSFSETLQTIKIAMERLQQSGLSLGRFELVVNNVKEEDWENSWKAYYHPVRLTRYLTIVPFWEDYVPEQEDEKLIRMDPGMAFGTGTHPTTRLSLEALETTLRGGEKVLDVGTGSGVLSIAAKLLGAAEVQAFDIDRVATRQAKLNISLNSFAAGIDVKENNLLAGIQESADVIVANILAEILLKMVKDTWNLLKEGGYFILSGVIRSKRDELLEELLDTGFILEEEKIMGDWHCLICRKEVERESCSDI